MRYEDLKTNEEKAEYLYCLENEIERMQDEFNQFLRSQQAKLDRYSRIYASEGLSLRQIMRTPKFRNSDALDRGVKELFDKIDRYELILNKLDDILEYIYENDEDIEPIENDNCYIFTYTFKDAVTL